MNSTPIAPADIRAGDLIRWEYAPGTERGDLRIAYEQIAESDGHRLSNYEGQHYLLARESCAAPHPADLRGAGVGAGLDRIADLLIDHHDELDGFCSCLWKSDFNSDVDSSTQIAYHVAAQIRDTFGLEVS